MVGPQPGPDQPLGGPDPARDGTEVSYAIDERGADRNSPRRDAVRHLRLHVAGGISRLVFA